MSRHPLEILSRLAIVLAFLLLALPLLSCSEDDDTPTGVQLPEGLYYNADNGHYYEAVSGGLTWAAARDSAETATYETLAGHLVCVDDEAENLFIYNELGKDVQRFWLGGFQDTDSPDFEEPAGGWYWCTGDALTYSAWYTGEPNNGGVENYLAFIWGDAPVWNDVPEAWNMNAGYIIEYE